MAKKDEQTTPEQTYKQRKRTGITLIVIGALALIAGIVLYFTFKGDRIIAISPIGYGALFLVIGIVVFATAKKKYEKELAEEQKSSGTSASATTVAKTAGSKIDLAASESGGELTEVDGRDMLKMLEHPEQVEKVTFRDSDNDIFEFDLLWGNVYDGVTYIVAARQEGDEYMKYIIRINNDEPSTAYYEVNDDIREAIKTDFINAMNAYTGQNSYTAEPAQGKKRGLMGGAKQRFIQTGEDNGKIKTFIVMACIYAVILAVGLIGYFTGFGLSGDNLIICKAFCIAYALITPSFLIYFGCHNPFNFKNVLSKTIMALGIIGMIVCIIFGFRLISEVGEVESTVWGFVVNTMLPIALIVATVAYIAAYVFWCNGLSSTWYLGIGIATTVIFPIATALMIAAFILYMLILIIKWLLSSIGIMAGDTALGRGFKAGWTGDNSYLGHGGYQITDEHGYTRTLTHYEGNRYRDDTGSFWVSDDGGHSFRRD